MLKKYFVFNWLLCSLLVAKAQSSANLNDLSGIALTSVYDNQFLSADSVLTEIQNKKTTIKSTYNLLYCNYLWWMIVTGDNSPKNQKLFLNAIIDVKKNTKVLGGDGLNDELLRNMIFAFAFKARFDLLNKNYINALKDLKNCIHYLQKSFGREEFYSYYKLSTGLYEYLSDYASQEYGFASLIFNVYPRGNKQKGLNYLVSAASSDNVFIKTESMYFLMRIYFDLEKNPTAALKYAHLLTQLYPENCIFILYKIQIFKTLNKPTEMQLEIDLFKQKLSRNKSLSEEQRRKMLSDLSDVFKKG